VPYFTFVSVVFVASGASDRRGPGFGTLARRNFTRLYLPFLVWTAFYLILRIGKHALRPESSFPPIGPHLLLVGSAHHLWYLPFLFVASLSTWAIAAALPAAFRPDVGVIAVAAGLAVAMIHYSVRHAPADPHFGNQLNYLLLLSWRALPSAFWGIAVGLHWQRLSNLLTARPVLSAGAALFTVALLRGSETGAGSVFRQNLAGVSAFVACAALPPSNRTITLAARYARYTFLVYLVHIACILALEPIFVPHREHVSLSRAVLLWIAATIMSFGTSVGLARGTRAVGCGVRRAFSLGR
jgi:fucose 4-O-acetylase-like acetyltransferase